MKCDMAKIHVGGAIWRSYCGGKVVDNGLVAVINCIERLTGDHSGDKSTPAKSTPADAITLKVSPNPVQNYTTINYTLSKQSKVSLVIYDYMMQPVKTLVGGMQSQGGHTITWDAKRSNGSNVGSGLYKIVATIDGKTYTVTVQVLK